MMIRSIADELVYNERRNEVLFVNTPIVARIAPEGRAQTASPRRFLRSWLSP